MKTFVFNSLFCGDPIYICIAIHRLRAIEIIARKFGMSEDYIAKNYVISEAHCDEEFIFDEIGTD